MFKMKTFLYVMVTFLLVASFSLYLSACKEDVVQDTPNDKNAPSGTIRLTAETSDAVVKDALLPLVPKFLKQHNIPEATLNGLKVEESSVLLSNGCKYLLVNYSTPKAEFGQILIKYADASLVKETRLKLDDGSSILFMTEAKSYTCSGDCGCRIDVTSNGISCGCQTLVGGCTLSVSD